MPPPKGCSTWSEGDVRVIEYRWRGLGIMAPFSAVLGLSLSFVGYMILTAEGNNVASWIIFAAGGPMLYWAAAGWFNRTVIRVSPEQITFQTNPVPSFGNSSVATRDVASVDLRISRTSTGGGRSSTTCVIWTEPAKGKAQQLSRGLLTWVWSINHAQFVHEALNAALVEVRPE